MLYLIRHPRPAIASGICYGQMDVPVSTSELNLAVSTLTPSLAELRPCRIFSSPLQRCLKLAEALSEHHQWIEPIVDHRLKEIHFGGWEGQCWDHIPRAEIDAWAADVEGYTPPGGESVRALKARVQNWLVDVANVPDPVVVITHAGVIRALLGLVNQQPLSTWGYAPVEYGELFTLSKAKMMAC